MKKLTIKLSINISSKKNLPTVEQRKTTVLEFKFKNKNLVKLCKIAEVSRSCIYLKVKLALVKPPGRTAPGFTVNHDGKIIYDKIIIKDLKLIKRIFYYLEKLTK